MAGPWTLFFSVLVPLPMPGSANVPVFNHPFLQQAPRNCEFCKLDKLTDGLPIH